MNELSLHPQGEPKKRRESDCRALVPAEGPVAVDTFGGRIHVEWDPTAAVTPLGQLPFFTDYLQVSGLFDPGWSSVRCSGPAPMHRPNATCSARRCCRFCAGTSATLTSAPCAETPLTPRCWAWRRWSARIRCAPHCSRLTRSLGYSGCRTIWCRSPSHCSASHGFSTSTLPSSPSTVVRKGRCSATTRTSRGVPRTPTIPISLPICAWYWM